MTKHRQTELNIKVILETKGINAQKVYSVIVLYSDHSLEGLTLVDQSTEKSNVVAEEKGGCVVICAVMGNAGEYFAAAPCHQPGLRSESDTLSLLRAQLGIWGSLCPAHPVGSR